MPGFPDWQKIVQWIGNPLFESTGVAYSNVGQTNLGQQGLAPAFRSVLLVASNATQNLRLDVVWFQTVSDLFGTFMQTVYVRQFSPAAFILPARGHGFSVFGQGGAAGTVDLAAYPTNLEGSGVLAGGWPGIQGAGVLATINGVAAAGATASTSMPAYFGPAQLAMTSGSPSWEVWVDHYDQTLSFVGRSYMSPVLNGSGVSQRIFLPPTLNQFVVLNGSGANASFLGSIIAAIDPVAS